MERQSQHERVSGIPDEFLDRAIVIVAADYNEDLRSRVKEVISQGGDALTFLGGSNGAADREAIELARMLRQSSLPGNFDFPKPE